MSRLMGNGSPYVLLDEQRRMSDAIAQLPLRMFYADRVKTMKSRTGPTSVSSCRLPWLQQGYSFVDVRGEEESGAGGVGPAQSDRSYRNRQEAQSVCRIVREVGERLQLVLGRGVSVITFYSAQVEEIEREMERQGMGRPGRRRGGVYTVDSFQGSEDDVIICSCVRANAGGACGFLADRRRLNVALTRARKLLVVVGSASTLRRSASEELRQLVADAEERNLLLEERTLGEGRMIGEGSVRLYEKQRRLMNEQERRLVEDAVRGRKRRLVNGRVLVNEGVLVDKQAQRRGRKQMKGKKRDRQGGEGRGRRRGRK
eukprot:766806-Hanusia_phi.AAC.10